MRFLRWLSIRIAAVVLILWAGLMVLRDMPPGAYQAADDSGMFVEVHRFFPVMQARATDGNGPEAALLLPVIRIGVPLDLYRLWRGHIFGYLLREDGHPALIPPDDSPSGAITLLPVDQAEADRLRAAWQQARDEAQEMFTRILQASPAADWTAPASGGRVNLTLPDNLHLFISERDPTRAVLYVADMPAARGFAMTISRGAQDFDRRDFADRFPRTQPFGRDGMIAQTPGGEFLIVVSDHNRNLVIEARARDAREAGLFVGAINGISDQPVPYALASGQYIGQPRPIPEIIRHEIGQALSPMRLLRTYEAGQARWEMMPLGDDGDAAEIRVTLQIALMPAEPQAPPDPGWQMLAADDTSGLRVWAHDATAHCVAQRDLPLGTAHTDDGQIGLSITAVANSLPACRDAAGILSGADLASWPEVARAARLAPHIGHYDRVREEGDGWAGINPDNSTVFDADGRVVATLNGMFDGSVGAYYIVEGPQGTGLADAQGAMILPAEYDGIAGFDNMGAPPDRLIHVRQNQRHGVYDLARQTFVVPFEYDHLHSLSGTGLLQAVRDGQFQLLAYPDMTPLPGGPFVSYIQGQPDRDVSDPERDVIALKRPSLDWVFWTRNPQPLLEGVFADVLIEQTSLPGLRLRVTRQDGSSFTINGLGELIEEGD